MRDIPMLFKAPMVNGLLDGYKTQTRRLANLKNATGKIETFNYIGTDNKSGLPLYEMKDKYGKHVYLPAGKHLQSPYFKPRVAPGFLVWVKETCRAEERETDYVDGVRYLANNHFETIEPTEQAASEWLDLFSIYGKRGATCPSIFMPRWASRITLLVTDVRVQRLQECSNTDAIAEGIEKIYYSGTDPKYKDSWAWKDYSDHPHSVAGFREDMPVLSYQSLWNNINGAGAWESNPFCVAYTFQVFDLNIDKHKLTLPETA